MKYLKYVALLGILLFAAGNAHAQVAVRVGVGPGYAGLGPAPVCAYGYYDYYPYACAPYGYYGPSYFIGGVFIGAGPWFHGYYGRGFYGSNLLVNSDLYRAGPKPAIHHDLDRERLIFELGDVGRYRSRTGQF